LMEINPLPTLFMRTVIQSLGMCPRLVGFVMNILAKLITKQVWRQPKVWQGFVKCCQMTKPQSFPVLLQLPVKQLENVFEISPEIKVPLIAHIETMTPHQRAHFSKTVLNYLSNGAKLEEPSPSKISTVQKSKSSTSSAGRGGKSSAPTSPPAESADTNEHDKFESKHDKSESKHDKSESKHDKSDSKHDKSYSKHDKSDSKHDKSDSKHDKSLAGEKRKRKPKKDSKKELKKEIKKEPVDDGFKDSKDSSRNSSRSNSPAPDKKGDKSKVTMPSTEKKRRKFSDKPSKSRDADT